MGGPNQQGGICDNGNLNTGLLTSLNYGQVVSPSVSTIVLAHEIGHNFGSEHDLVRGTSNPSMLQGQSKLSF